MYVPLDGQEGWDMDEWLGHQAFSIVRGISLSAHRDPTDPSVAARLAIFEAYPGANSNDDWSGIQGVSVEPTRESTVVEEWSPSPSWQYHS